LERLQTFKCRYGDCMVPAIYPDDLQLGMEPDASSCKSQLRNVSPLTYF
jgi:hypothetical protein